MPVNLGTQVQKLQLAKMTMPASFSFSSYFLAAPKNAVPLRVFMYYSLLTLMLLTRFGLVHWFLRGRLRTSRVSEWQVSLCGGVCRKTFLECIAPLRSKGGH